MIPHNINPGEIQDYSTKSLVLSALKYCTEFEPLFFLASVETYLDKLESNRCLLPLFGVFYISATQRKLIANMF